MDPVTALTTAVYLLGGPYLIYNYFHNPPMKLQDYLRHFYAIGKTGTGKSTTIREGLIKPWVKKGYGLLAIETKDRQTIDDIINCIPEQLHEKVIVFDPLDMARHGHYIGLNLLHGSRNIETWETLICGEVLANLKRFFGEMAIQARSEDILRNATLAVLEQEEGSLLEVYQMLTNAEYRELAIRGLNNLVVKDYYESEFQAGADALQAPKNKLRAFIINPLIRKIMCQLQGLDVRQIIEQGKILLVSLPKGVLGEDTTRLLAGTILSKAQLAAQSRADMPIKERLKRPFMVIADEFQDYCNSSFNTFLEQSRGFGISLVIAHQLLNQQGINEGMIKSILGNVGNFLIFRVGPYDAPILSRIVKVKAKEQLYDENFLLNMQNHTYLEKLLIDDKQHKPRLRCNSKPSFEGDFAESMRRYSVLKYGVPEFKIEGDIRRRMHNEYF